MQKRISQLISRFSICSAIQQRFGNRDVSSSRCHMECSTVLEPLLSVDVRSTPDQNTHDICRICTICPMGRIAYEIQRCVPPLVSRVGVSPQVQKECHHGETPLACHFV